MNMREDQIVKEIRQFRDERAAKLGYNLRAIAEDARKREQQQSKWQVISLARPKQHTRGSS
jgi:hypothetical protein